MNTVEIYNGISLTMKDLRDFVEQANHGDSFIPDSTEILIAQHKEDIVSHAVHIIGDKDSINIYDWI